jgi:hypothetical protein
MRTLSKRQPADVMTQLAKAAEGLLFSSESDYPLTPFSLRGPAPFTPDALYELTSLPKSAPITRVDFDAFFAPMLSLSSGASAEARQRVGRFQKLAQLLRKNLSGIAVYKLGAVEMPVFIVGRLPDGSFGGLRTTVVET